MSEWTFDTLKAYFDAVLAERDQAVKAALASQERAVSAALAAAEKAASAALTASDRAVQKAEAAAEKRFESVNEFRNTLRDQQSGLISRAEADSEFRALRERIETMAARLDRSEGRGSGMHQGWLVLLGAVGLISTLLGIGGVMFAVLGR